MFGNKANQLSEIKIARLILGFENFALNYSISSNWMVNLIALLYFSWNSIIANSSNSRLDAIGLSL